MRRFCGCDKGMRSIPATAKMWWSEAWERSDLAERNPRRSSAEAYTILLGAVAVHYVHVTFLH